MKLFETVQPWKLENNELKTRSRNVSDELRKTLSELDKYTDVSMPCSIFNQNVILSL